MKTSRARRMRTGRALALSTALACATIAAATPAAASAAALGRSYTEAISPAYTTAGQPTTFTVTIRNTSTAANISLRASNLTPPAGFKLMTRVLLLRRAHGKVGVQHNVLNLRSASVPRGGMLQTQVTAIAPSTECNKPVFRWHSSTFQAASATGPALALQATHSSLGTTVTCLRQAPCGDGGPACSTSEGTNVSSYTATSNAGSGTLDGGLDVGTHLTCAGYTSQDPNWYESIVDDTSPGVVYQIQYTLKNSHPKLVRACVGLPYEFTAASGKPAHSGTLPNGTAGFIALLPRCPAQPTGPCVVSKTPLKDPNSKTGFDTKVVVQIPVNGPGDPWFGP